MSDIGFDMTRLCAGAKMSDGRRHVLERRLLTGLWWGGAAALALMAPTFGFVDDRVGRDAAIGMFAAVMIMTFVMAGISIFTGWVGPGRYVEAMRLRPTAAASAAFVGWLDIHGVEVANPKKVAEDLANTIVPLQVPGVDRFDRPVIVRLDPTTPDLLVDIHAS